MTLRQDKLPSQSAALAGIPAGVQTLGPWSGRRQLFVKFAEEAETATIYSVDALRTELKRLSGRSTYHSVAVVGRDVLAEEEFLLAAFGEAGPLPLMLDHDGQRPDALGSLVRSLSLVQVTLDGTEKPSSIERTCATLRLAASKHVAHAVAIVPGEALSDGPLFRIVEQIHEASNDTQIVVHPVVEQSVEHDRRWVIWLERAMSVHTDVRVLPKWPTKPAR